jgi:hypothetical protein
VSQEVRDRAAPPNGSGPAASSAIASERTFRSLAPHRDARPTEAARPLDVSHLYEERCLDILLTQEAIERLPERDAPSELLEEYRADLAELATRRRAVGRGLEARTKSAAELRAERRFEAIVLAVEREPGRAETAAQDGPFSSLQRARQLAWTTVFRDGGGARPSGGDAVDRPQTTLPVSGRDADRGKVAAPRRLVAVGSVVAVALLATAVVIAATGGGDDRSASPTVSRLGSAAGLEKLQLGTLVKAGERAQARELAAARARAAARREAKRAAAKAEAKAERAAAAEAAAPEETTTTTPAPETTTAAPATAPAPAPEPAAAPAPSPAPEPAPAPSGGSSDCFTFEC